MRVKVSRQNIKDGKVGSFRRCPVGLAIREKPGCVDAAVAHDYVVIYRSEGPAYRYRTDVACSEFVRKFDRGEKVNPCIITLRRLGRVLRVGG